MTTTKAIADFSCPKCGVIPNSGKLNCCAVGGAWSGECGDDGDPNFEHTWADGVRACKRECDFWDLDVKS